MHQPRTRGGGEPSNYPLIIKHGDCRWDIHELLAIIICENHQTNWQIFHYHVLLPESTWEKTKLVGLLAKCTSRQTTGTVAPMR